MVQGVDNIGICATDVERSVSFYQRLGFSEAYRNDRGVLMAAGTAHLFIFAARQSNPPVGRELGLFGNPPGKPIGHLWPGVSPFTKGRGRHQAAPFPSLQGREEEAKRQSKVCRRWL